MATLASARNKYVRDSVQTMSPGRMIVALYDRVILDLDRAEAAMTTSDVFGAHTALMHAQEIVDLLYTSLDVKRWPAGAQLLSVYRTIAAELVAANVAKDAQRVRTCRALLAPLRDAWRDAAGIVATPGSDVG
jgi:flagellar protein FliS